MPLEPVIGTECSPSIYNISASGSPATQEKLLNNFFMELLGSKKKSTAHPQLLAIYQQIVEKKGCCSVEELAHDLHCSKRTVQRLFKAHVGISPKNYLKTIRFNHACQLMHQHPHIDWFDIVCECGYYDQMHFIHEFISIMGCPPQKFLEKCGGKFYFLRPFLIKQLE